MDVTIQYKENQDYTPLYPNSLGRICEFNNNNTTTTDTSIRTNNHIPLESNIVQDAFEEIDERINLNGMQNTQAKIPFGFNPTTTKVVTNLDPNENDTRIMIADLSSPISYIWYNDKWHVYVAGQDWNGTSLGNGYFTNQDAFFYDNAFWIVHVSYITRITFNNSQLNIESLIPPSTLRSVRFISGAIGTMNDSEEEYCIWIGTDPTGTTGDTLVYQIITSRDTLSTDFSNSGKWTSRITRTSVNQVASYIFGNDEFMYAVTSTTVYCQKNNSTDTVHSQALTGYTRCAALGYSYVGSEGQTDVGLNVVTSDSDNSTTGYVQAAKDWTGNSYTGNTIEWKVSNNVPQWSKMRLIYWSRNQTWIWISTSDFESYYIATSTTPRLTSTAWSNQKYGYSLYPTEYQYIFDAGDFELIKWNQYLTKTESSAPFYAFPATTTSGSVNGWNIIMASGHILQTNNLFVSSITEQEMLEGFRTISCPTPYPYWRKIIQTPYFNQNESDIFDTNYLALGSASIPAATTRLSNVGGANYDSTAYGSLSSFGISKDGKHWIGAYFSNSFYTDLNIYEGYYFMGEIQPSSGTQSGLAVSVTKGEADYILIDSSSNSNHLDVFNNENANVMFASNHFGDVMMASADCNLGMLGTNNLKASTTTATQQYGRTEFDKILITKDGSGNKTLEKYTNNSVGLGLYLGLRSTPATGRVYIAGFNSVSSTQPKLLVAIPPSNNSAYGAQEEALEFNAEDNVVAILGDSTIDRNFVMIQNNYYGTIQHSYLGAKDNFYPNKLGTWNINIFNTIMPFNDLCLNGYYYMVSNNNNTSNMNRYEIVPFFLDNSKRTNCSFSGLSDTISKSQPIYAQSVGGNLYFSMWTDSFETNFLNGGTTGYELYFSEAVR